MRDNSLPTDPRADSDIVQGVKTGNTASFELLMRRHNNRLFRVARSIVKEENLAMDIVQESWLKVYLSLDTFRGPDGFASWASRIAHNNALMHLRKEQRVEYWEDPLSNERKIDNEEGGSMANNEPLDQLAQQQLNSLLEQAIDRLPLIYRAVFVMRAVQQLNTEETATSLGLKVDTVKQRFLRGKRIMRKELSYHIEQSGLHIYEFAGYRCDTIVKNVFASIARS